MRKGLFAEKGSAEHRVDEQSGDTGIDLPDGWGGMGIEGEDDEDGVGREPADVLVEGCVIEALEGDGKGGIEIGGQRAGEDLG